MPPQASHSPGARGNILDVFPVPTAAEDIQDGALLSTRCEEDVLKALQHLNVEEVPSYTFVDSESALVSVLDCLVDLPVTPPSIYVDLEGVRLSRYGTISIMQIFILPQDHTYLIDVHRLQDRTFSIVGERKDNTLRQILESQYIPKVIFDVRNDSDALFHLFGIRLAGMQDLQLMEIATRSGPRRYLNGLSKCIERDISMTYPEEKQWKETKEKGVKLFAPERGGSYEVFNTRPMAEEMIRYCVQDVQLLGKLWEIYDRKITSSWRARVTSETSHRIKFSQGDIYLGEGKHKALAPNGW